MEVRVVPFLKQIAPIAVGQWHAHLSGLPPTRQLARLVALLQANVDVGQKHLALWNAPGDDGQF